MIDFDRLPAPGAKNIALRVKAAAERAIRQGHPWVYEDSIVKQSHLGNAGDLAVIYDSAKNGFLAVGLYDPFSPIRVKILQRETPERINQGLVRRTNWPRRMNGARHCARPGRRAIGWFMARAMDFRRW